MLVRCAWVPVDDELYAAYHDEQWGVPVYDERELFEMLVLEGAQAGLSWSTILRKRNGYRAAFDGFDPERVAAYDDAKIAELLADAGIVRNRRKIEAAIGNARVLLDMHQDGETLTEALWAFVDGRPIRNAWGSLSQIPAQTERSIAMSKFLSKRGFRFVGPTICYAFMQAVGMVNDHTTDCFRYHEL